MCGRESECVPPLPVPPQGNDSAALYFWVAVCLFRTILASEGDAALISVVASQPAHCPAGRTRCPHVKDGLVA